MIEQVQPAPEASGHLGVGANPAGMHDQRPHPARMAGSKIGGDDRSEGVAGKMEIA
jgi:hypothetical protein